MRMLPIFLARSAASTPKPGCDVAKRRLTSAARIRAAPPQHDLILANVEAAERVHVLDLKRVPRNVDDALCLVVDEMMMCRQLGIEDDLALGQYQLAQQALFDEQVQRVVHG